MTYEQALEVARADYNVGISYAIDTLKDMGFDCSQYYKTMAEVSVDDEDFDDKNTLARNTLFITLGIYEIMRQAYEEVWQ